MTLLAHLTSFDLPSLAVALAVGVAIGFGLAVRFGFGRHR